MTYEEYPNEAYNLYTIKTDKFRICRLEVVFYKEFDYKDINEINMLTDVLGSSSSNYASKKEVNLKLEDLYDASFFVTTSRVGSLRTINFIIDFLDPKYADKTYLNEIVSFLFQMIFNPNIKNNKFNQKEFDIAKNKETADILSTKESAVKYALKRALKGMDDKHPASYDILGTIDELNKVTPSSLVDTYNNIINNYACSVFAVGNLNMPKLNELINKYFKNNIIKELNIPIYTHNKKQKIKNIEEQDDFKQASLFMIYNTSSLNTYEKNIVFNIFNAIFANGSLDTKLSQALREKNSLCYQSTALYQKYDNLLIVYAGIDSKNKNKAVKLVKKAMQEMSKGDFSDDDLDNAKKKVVSWLLSAMDNPASLIDNYFFSNIAGIYRIEEQITKIDEVTKEDIINLANKLKLNTIYLMKEENDERD